MILNKRIKDNKIKQDNLIKEAQRKDELIKKALTLCPRVQKILDTANALVENGYIDFLYGGECQVFPSFNKRVKSFVSEGFYHELGLIGELSETTLAHYCYKIPPQKPFFKFMGIVAGGWNGDYDTLIDGNDIYISKHGTTTPIGLEFTDRWYYHCDRMIKEFEEYEKRFFEKVEEFLNK